MLQIEANFTTISITSMFRVNSKMQSWNKEVSKIILEMDPEFKSKFMEMTKVSS